MLYQIAGLTLEMEPVGDMPRRMRAYEVQEGQADIRMSESDYRLKGWLRRTDDLNLAYYMETGRVFHNKILPFDGMMLHASAIVMDGYAYLFSGPSGMGKSTHTRLYLQTFGQSAVIINDDKPTLRRQGQTWYAYGTPWCGKDGINRNLGAPLAGICFLHRGDRLLCRLSPAEAAIDLIRQTQHYQKDEQNIRMLLALIDHLAREIPVFSFHNHAQPEDAMLTYTAMAQAIKENQA